MSFDWKKWLLTFLHGLRAWRAPSRPQERAWWCELSAGSRWWSPAWSRRWCFCAGASGIAPCSGFPRIWLSVARTTYGRSTCRDSLGLVRISARAFCRPSFWIFYTGSKSRWIWLDPIGLPWLERWFLWRRRSCFVCTFECFDSVNLGKECKIGHLYEIIIIKGAWKLRPIMTHWLLRKGF